MKGGKVPFEDVIVHGQEVEVLAVVGPDGVVDLFGSREGGQLGESLQSDELELLGGLGQGEKAAVRGK